MGTAAAMGKRRIIWSSAGEIDLPDLPPECVNQLHIDLEWMKEFMDLYWGRTRRSY